MRLLSRILIKPQVRSLRFSTAAALENAKLFPNERYGVNYATNWAISALGVSVKDLAFRNATNKTLLTHVMKSDYDSQSKTLSFGMEEGALYQMPPMDAETFEDISLACKESMSQSVLFMHDGFAAGIPIRVVTNDALLASYVKRLLSATQLEANDFEPAAVLLHSNIPDEAASGPYCAVSANTVISRGRCTPSIFAKALSTALASCCDQLILPGDLCLDRNDDLVAIIGAPDTGYSTKFGELLAGHGWIWNRSGGASRLWQSAFTLEKEMKTPAIKYDGRFLRDFEGAPRMYGHPKKIVIVTGQKEEGSQPKAVEHGKALEMYNDFGLLKSKAQAALFGELLTESGSQVINM